MFPTHRCTVFWIEVMLAAEASGVVQILKKKKKKNRLPSSGKMRFADSQACVGLTIGAGGALVADDGSRG